MFSLRQFFVFVQLLRQSETRSYSFCCEWLRNCLQSYITLFLLRLLLELMETLSEATLVNAVRRRSS